MKQGGCQLGGVRKNKGLRPDSTKNIEGALSRLCLKCIRSLQFKNMMKKLNPGHLFLALSLPFAYFLLRSPSEALWSGLIYSLSYAIYFHRPLRPRVLFPLGMLFIFLLVLTQVPEKAFTNSLVITVQVLIAFRGLLLAMMEMQKSKESLHYSRILFVAGLSVEFGMNAFLLWSTFRVSGASLLVPMSWLHLRVITFVTVPYLVQRIRTKALA